MVKIYDPRNVRVEELKQRDEFVIMHPSGCEASHDAAERLMDGLLPTHSHRAVHLGNGDYHLYFIRRRT